MNAPPESRALRSQSCSAAPRSAARSSAPSRCSRRSAPSSPRIRQPDRGRSAEVWIRPRRRRLIPRRRLLSFLSYFFSAFSPRRLRSERRRHAQPCQTPAVKGDRHPPLDIFLLCLRRPSCSASGSGSPLADGPSDYRAGRRGLCIARPIQRSAPAHEMIPARPLRQRPIVCRIAAERGLGKRRRVS